MPLEICAAEPRISILVHEIFSINRISLTSYTESQRTVPSMSFSLTAIRLKNSTFYLVMILLPWPCPRPHSLASDQMLHVPGQASNAPSSFAKVKDIFDSLKRVLSQADV
jgi:hypothetical protein